jgi:hypothetical protein
MAGVIVGFCVTSTSALAQVKSAKTELARVRYDGLYFSETPGTNERSPRYQYVRFFEDGTLVTVVELTWDMPDLRRVSPQLQQSRAGDPGGHGRYRIKGDTIQVTLAGKTYEGLIDGNYIRMKTPWGAANEGASVTFTHWNVVIPLPSDDPARKLVPASEPPVHKPAPATAPEPTYGWHLSYWSLLYYLPVVFVAPLVAVAAGRYLWGGKRYLNTLGMVYAGFGCIGFILVGVVWLLFIVIGRAAGAQDQDGLAGFGVLVGLPCLYASGLYLTAVLNIGIGLPGSTTRFWCGRCRAGVSCWKLRLDQPPKCPRCGVYFDTVEHG